MYCNIFRRQIGRHEALFARDTFSESFQVLKCILMIITFEEERKMKKLNLIQYGKNSLTVFCNKLTRVKKKRIILLRFFYRAALLCTVKY